MTQPLTSTKLYSDWREIKTTSNHNLLKASLCARSCADCFAPTVSFNPHIQKVGYRYSPHFKGEEAEAERWQSAWNSQKDSLGNDMTFGQDLKV
ncbi:hypothetical protein TM43_08570 [Campylobacter jejuni subsp. jejuni]|nr:hypothetical protein TM43_08570 [Campylobacter jejuni subsp. jejuni]